MLSVVSLRGFDIYATAEWLL